MTMKKKVKQSCAMLLAVIMIFSLMPAAAFPAFATEETDTVENIQVTEQAVVTADDNVTVAILDDGTVEVTAAQPEESTAAPAQESDAVTTAETTPEPINYYCARGEHVHTEECERIFHVLMDPEIEHEHAEECYSDYRMIACGLEEHVHSRECLNKDYKLPTPEAEAKPETFCGMEEHIHNYFCIEKLYYKDQIICENKDPDHEHTDDCYAFDYIFGCGLEGHLHTEICYIDPNAEKEEPVEDEQVANVEDQEIEEQEYQNSEERDAGDQNVEEQNSGEQEDRVAEEIHEEVVATVEEVSAAEETQESDNLADDTEEIAEEETSSGTSERVTETKEIVLDEEISTTKKPDATEEPTQEVETISLKAYTEDRKIFVSVVAPEGAFPTGTTMRVVDMSSDADTVKAVTEAAESSDDVSGKIAGVQAVDITFLNARGKEIEPALPISVMIRSDFIEQAENLVVVHVPEDEEATVIEQKESAVDEVRFETDSFSVYAVVYTVDFGYELNGTTFEASIIGGSAIDLENLLLALHVTDENNISDLIADVEKVEFSDPEKVAVIRATKVQTIIEMEMENGLAPQYSEMSSEAIREIESRETRVGSWYLVSLIPFITDETLTVTLKNGDVITIAVSDEGAVSTEEYHFYYTHTAGGYIVGGTTEQNTLTGITTQMAQNDPGYKFVGWYENGVRVSSDVYLYAGGYVKDCTSDHHFEARFEKKTDAKITYKLTESGNSLGRIRYASETVLANQEASGGYTRPINKNSVFIGWVNEQGILVATANQCEQVWSNNAQWYVFKPTEDQIYDGAVYTAMYLPSNTSKYLYVHADDSSHGEVWTNYNNSVNGHASIMGVMDMWGSTGFLDADITVTAKDGWRFDHWEVRDKQIFTDDSGTVKAGRTYWWWVQEEPTLKDAKLTKGMNELVAVFAAADAPAHKITYAASPAAGGTVSRTSDTWYGSNTSSIQGATATAKSDYAFGGWVYFNDEGMQVSATGSGTTTFVPKGDQCVDRTYYAVFRKKQNLVGYNMNMTDVEVEWDGPADIISTSSVGAPMYYSSKSYNNGDKFNIVSNIPKADGFEFLGWYDKDRKVNNVDVPGTIYARGDTRQLTFPYNGSNSRYTLEAIWGYLNVESKVLPYDGEEHVLHASAGLSAGSIDGTYSDGVATPRYAEVIEQMKQDGKFKLKNIQYELLDENGNETGITIDSEDFARTEPGEYKTKVTATFIFDDVSVEVKKEATLTIYTGKVVITKNWNDRDNKYGLRPDDLDAPLMQAVQVNEEDENGKSVDVTTRNDAHVVTYEEASGGLHTEEPEWVKDGNIWTKTYEDLLLRPEGWSETDQHSGYYRYFSQETLSGSGELYTQTEDSREVEPDGKMTTITFENTLPTRPNIRIMKEQLLTGYGGEKVVRNFETPYYVRIFIGDTKDANENKTKYHEYGDAGTDLYEGIWYLNDEDDPNDDTIAQPVEIEGVEGTFYRVYGGNWLTIKEVPEGTPYYIVEYSDPGTAAVRVYSYEEYKTDKHRDDIYKQTSDEELYYLFGTTPDIPQDDFQSYYTSGEDNDLVIRNILVALVAPADPITLTVNKRLEGNGDSNATFDFIIKLYNSDGTPYINDVPDPLNAWTWHWISDGVYDFTLGDGESISIELEAGVQYEITEDPGDFESSVNGTKEGSGETFSGNIDSGASGTLSNDDGNVSLEFTNTYNGVDILIKKEWDGITNRDAYAWLAPDGIPFTIYGAGEELDHFTLSEENDWTYEYRLNESKYDIESIEIDENYFETPTWLNLNAHGNDFYNWSYEDDVVTKGPDQVTEKEYRRVYTCKNNFEDKDILSITKIDQYWLNVGGASLQLEDGDGTVLASWVTGGDKNDYPDDYAQTFTLKQLLNMGIEDGDEIYLVETEAPVNHDVMPNRTISVSFGSNNNISAVDDWNIPTADLYIFKETGCPRYWEYDLPEEFIVKVEIHADDPATLYALGLEPSLIDEDSDHIELSDARILDVEVADNNGLILTFAMSHDGYIELLDLPQGAYARITEYGTNSSEYNKAGLSSGNIAWRGEMTVTRSGDNGGQDYLDVDVDSEDYGNDVCVEFQIGRGAEEDFSDEDRYEHLSYEAQLSNRVQTIAVEKHAENQDGYDDVPGLNDDFFGFVVLVEGLTTDAKIAYEFANYDRSFDYDGTYYNDGFVNTVLAGAPMSYGSLGGDTQVFKFVLRAGDTWYLAPVNPGAIVRVYEVNVAIPGQDCEDALGNPIKYYSTGIADNVESEYNVSDEKATGVTITDDYIMGYAVYSAAVEVPPYYEHVWFETTNYPNRTSLSIDKEVDSDDADYRTDTFPFTIEVNGVGNQSYDVQYQRFNADGEWENTTTGSITFSNGTANVDLGHNRKIIIYNLPVGAVYEVTEGSVEGYILKDKEGDVGTLSSMNNNEVHFINEPEKDFDLHVSKRAMMAENGQGLSFNFEIVFSNVKNEAEANQIRDAIGKTDDVWIAEGSSYDSRQQTYTVRFYMYDGDTIWFTSLPAHLNYQVIEGENGNEIHNYTVIKYKSSNGGGILASASYMNDSACTDVMSGQDGSMDLEFDNYNNVVTVHKFVYDAFYGMYGIFDHLGPTEDTVRQSTWFPCLLISDDNLDEVRFDYSDYLDSTYVKELSSDKLEALMAYLNDPYGMFYDVYSSIPGLDPGNSYNREARIYMRPFIISGNCHVNILGLPENMKYRVLELSTVPLNDSYGVQNGSAMTGYIGRLSDDDIGADYEFEDDYLADIENVLTAVVSDVRETYMGSDQHITFENTPEPAVLTINKIVTGGGGDRTKQFEFTLMLTNPDGTPFDLFDVTSSNANIDFRKTSTGVYSFKMSGGDSFSISVPSGTIYQIREDPDGYACSVKITDGREEEIDNESSAPAAKGQLRPDTTTVTYTNKKTMVVPTGIDLPVLTGVILVTASAAAVILYQKKRKRSAES